MKTIINLTGKTVDTNFQEPPFHHHHIGQAHPVDTSDRRKGSYTRYMRCGPAGIILSNGKASVVIPEAEIWKLAEQSEPALSVPKKIEAPSNAGILPPDLGQLS